MKRLLTISALLLFSVDVFADRYCYVSDDNFWGLDEQIRERCDEDDVIYAVVKKATDKGIQIMNRLSSEYCDFKQEIIINSDNISTTYLQCVMFDDRARQPSLDSFKE